MVYSEIISIEEVGEIETIDIEVSGDNLFLADDILTHNSAVGITAIDHSHIAGGLGKIKSADIVLSIIWTEQMRDVGEIIFSFIKTRNSDGLGKYALLEFDKNFTKIKSPPPGYASVLNSDKPEKGKHKSTSPLDIEDKTAPSISAFMDF